MPALGMAQETGKLVRWLKREGDTVSKGEPLMEVETDKATVEVEAPASGVLRAVSASEGDDIEVGHAIAVIVATGEATPQLAPSARASVPVRPPSSSTAQPGAVQPRVLNASRQAASPKARRLAAERGVELSAVKGSGPGGAVLEDDLLQAGGGEPTLWRAMAENVSRSWREAPHFFVFREVDAAQLATRGRDGKDAVTVTDRIVYAVARALRLHPRMNGMNEEVNIGLAVALPDGLLVPVIHRADALELGEIAAYRRGLLDELRSGKVRSASFGRGTFTVSNLGMYGVDLFTAILTEGQAGILAVGRITERAVAVHGEVRVRPTMLMSLSCDHRRVDGARAAEFMSTFVELLEVRG